MSQVWIIRNSDTDVHLFNRFEHLERSVAITFCRCQNVRIETIEHTARKVVFHVTAEYEGQPREETITAECYPVWTEPSHL